MKRLASLASRVVFAAVRVCGARGWHRLAHVIQPYGTRLWMMQHYDRKGRRR